jgi:hypothetical protein
MRGSQSREREARMVYGRPQLGCVDGLPHRRDQPVHHRMDGLLSARGLGKPVSRSGWMATPPPAADPLEALEDRRRQTAQPADTRYLRAQRPPLGRQRQGILADRRLRNPPRGFAQHLLGPSRPQDPQPNLATSPYNGLTNRRMRARMSGGVRGGGATPPPTRSKEKKL